MQHLLFNKISHDFIDTYAPHPSAQLAYARPYSGTPPATIHKIFPKLITPNPSYNQEHLI